jgi:hypothetical protein
VLNILFWNFRCAEADPGVIAARVALYHKVDVLALAESTAHPERLLDRLREGDSRFDRPIDPHHRVQFFTRFPAKHLELFRYDDRLDLRRLRLPGRKEILLGAIHFYDPRNFANPDARYSRCLSVRQTMRDAERDAGHRRTILMGDFNMNPFDKGMIDPNIGFGAVMNRDLASRLSAGEDTPPRFYNPLWARLGRRLPEPPGTFYWKNVADPLNTFWHYLDQVLIRPALLDAFEDESLRILTSIPGPSPSGGTIELIHSARKHWVVRISDHLLILFRLEPPEEDDHG